MNPLERHDDKLERTSAPIAFLDGLIPENAKLTSDELYRSRILMGICLIITAIILCFIIGVGLAPNIDAQTKLGGFVITLPCGIFFVFITLYFKNTGNYLLCANLMTFFACIAVSAGVFISGGPLVSPATYVMAVPALLGFCLVGRNWGLFWAAAVFIIQVIMLVMAIQHYEFINTVTVESAAINEATDWTIAYLLTIAIVLVYESMQSRLMRERDAQEKRFLFLATHDGLTKLPNRILFYDRVKTAMARSKRNKKPFALFYLDLDGFKPVNDTYGHEAGDHVLVIAAERFRSALRESDLVARFGGDEFAVVAENIEDRNNAYEIGNKLIAAIQKPIRFEQHQIQVGTSIGVCFYPDHGDTVDELLSTADAAMYQAKKSKGQIIISQNTD